MKIVIDTNVVVSGIIFGGIPAQILAKVFNNSHQIIALEYIISEYFDIIHRVTAKRKFSPVIAMQTLNDLISNADILDASKITAPECADPDDIKFLQAAIAGKAKFLISGDKHLLDVGKYKGGIVLKPKEFLLSI